MAFDLSARITADASGLERAADQGAKALDNLGSSAKNAANTAKELESATESSAKASTRLGENSRALAARQTEAMRAVSATTTETVKQTAERSRAITAATRAAIAEQRLASATSQAERSAAAAALASLKLQEAQERVAGGSTRLGAAVAASGNSANASQAAYKNLGYQLQDIGAQVASGTSFVRAFSQQSGQLFSALADIANISATAGGGIKQTGESADQSGDQVKGLGEDVSGVAEKVTNTGSKFGKFAAFLAGPWGAALTVAASLVAPLIAELFKAEEAAKAVELQSTGLGAAQSALGEIFDLTTGKLKKQNSELAASNELLRLNIRLTAINLRTEALQNKQDASDAFENVGSVSVKDRVKAGLGNQGGLAAQILGAVGGSVQGRTNAQNLSRVVADLQAGKTSREEVLRASQRLDFTGTGTNRQEFQKALLDDAAAESKTAIADLIDKSLNDKELAGALRRDGRTKKPRVKKPKSTAAVDEFGRDAADRLASIAEQFDTTPPVIANVNKQLRQLDDLIDDLGRRKPPNFKQLIDDANALKPLIENSLTKPFREYLKAQDEQLAVQRLTSAGRFDEANALRVVQQLQAQMGPLTDQQKDSVLATVQAMRAQQRELDVLREKNAKYLEALGGIKGVVEDASQEFVRGDLGQLLKSPGKLIDAFQTLQGRKLFDSIFGDIFRDLEDQVNGTSVVKDASERMADAVKVAAEQTRATGEAVASFKPPVDDATAALGGFTAALNGASSAVAGGGGAATGGRSLASLLAGYRGPTGPTAQSGIDPGTGDIVVVGRRNAGGAGGALTSGSLFERALSGIGSKVAGAFTNPENAKRIGASFGQYGGKAIAGAATGAATANIAAPLVKALGLKTSNTGAAIGGALGSFGGPIGSAIGGVLGSVVGGLFKTTKTGSATLGNVGGASAITGTGGNNAALRASSSGLAGGVASNLDNIVSALGGSLGNFSVSIGERKGRFVVDRAGQGRVKTGGTGGVVDSYTTAEEAQAVALRDAILDGAVQGISAAMQAAIRQNSDVNKAVNEALGVKALESRLKGLNGTLAGIFDTEATSAKERLRLAKAYGLDVAAVERDNVQTRTKLIEDTLKSRIGGLSSFLDALKFGDLAEGSPVERLAALSKQIATVQADAEAGKDGAADQLANLLAQKVALSRDSFGTAGAQFSGDRAGAQSAAERVIEMERQRVNEAAGVTTAAQAATTAAVNETNDLIAIQNAKLDTLIATVASLGGVSGATPNYGSVLRTASSQ